MSVLHLVSPPADKLVKKVENLEKNAKVYRGVCTQHAYCRIFNIGGEFRYCSACSVLPDWDQESH